MFDLHALQNLERFDFESIPSAPFFVGFIIIAFVVILALIKKGDVRAGLKLPGLLLTLEAKDRRAPKLAAQKESANPPPRANAS